MPDEKRLAIDTVAVHAGRSIWGSKAQPIVPPIHMSAVSYFDSADELDHALDGHDFSYGRINSQASSLLEEAIARLEGAEDCAVYASGMAAVRALLDAQPFKPGDRIVIPSDSYGVSRLLCKQFAAERGLEVHSVPMHEDLSPAKLKGLNPKFVLAESIGNPLLTVPHLRGLAQVCKIVGATFAVDATFASPVLQRPLELGADYSLQSMTKFINGHSDATGGSISASREKVAALKKARIVHGAVLGPFEAWLTLRGLRTLPLRMRQHCANAARVAKRLSDANFFDTVIYPGLTNHPQHQFAVESLSTGFGGLVSFEIHGADRPTCFRFLERVKLAKAAPSLGDVSTFVMHAASASARRMTPEEREAAGIRENLIRVSVGLEDPDEIADDLLQAVESALDDPETTLKSARR